MGKISVENLNALIKTLKDSGFLSTKELVDGYYSVKELYEHRLILFRNICATYPQLSWKAKRHNDGTMFNDSFLVGITTMMGTASYHFKINRYDDFNIRELEYAPAYDGYTPEEALVRLSSLPIIGSDYRDSEPLNTYIDYGITEESANELSIIMNDLIRKLREMDLIKTVELSDGNHTLKQLYKQKRELFRLIAHNYADVAWKSKYDHNGEVVSHDTFLAGLYTPTGPVGYAFNAEYYDTFNVLDISHAPIEKSELHRDVVKKLSSMRIRQYTK